LIEELSPGPVTVDTSVLKKKHLIFLKMKGTIVLNILVQKLGENIEGRPPTKLPKNVKF